MNIQRICSVILVLAIGGCHHGDTSSPVRLQWLAEPSVKSANANLLRAFATTRVALAPIVDNRSQPDVIGHFVNEDHIPVTTTDNVALFVGERLTDELSRAGMHMEDATGAASIGLVPELLVYQMEEDGKFNANVRIRFVLTRNGTGYWTEVFDGSGSTWGRTHSHENINQSLSAATDDAINKLLASESFAAALSAR